MANPHDASSKASPEQLTYARILEIGMYFGLLLLLVTFCIYVFGVLEPYVPTHQLPHYWTMSAHEYTEHANIETGWGWTKLVGHGDFLNYIGIALLAGVTIICYASIIPVLVRNRDTVYVIIAVLEILVLVLAASGILASGH
jgi:hypothetical protein